MAIVQARVTFLPAGETKVFTLVKQPLAGELLETVEPLAGEWRVNMAQLATSEELELTPEILYNVMAVKA